MNVSLIEELKSKFSELYNRDGGPVCFAPGRVNLIGEHTDYNGGHVFPCALSMGTYGIIMPRDDRTVRMYSLNFPDDGIIEVALDELRPGRTKRWSQYPEGVFWTFVQKGFNISRGADLIFGGDVPAGSGLSSSASIEVLTGLLIREMYGFEVSGTELALFGQYSENNYNGCQCGIMDQFSSAMGRKDHAIFLDTNTLEYQPVPLRLGDCELIITNSAVKHSLVTSAYNDRRRECAEALATLQEHGFSDRNGLCCLSPEEFEGACGYVADEVNRRRAKHAVYENARTEAAVRALVEDDIEAFGKLMNASHESLRDDYEVSCEEVDYLVALAQAMPGVVGSRITGGGFGGCTVSIVKKDAAAEFEEEISRKYYQKFGIKAEFYRAMPEEGAHVITK